MREGEGNMRESEKIRKRTTSSFSGRIILDPTRSNPAQCYPFLYLFKFLDFKFSFLVFIQVSYDGYLGLSSINDSFKLFLKINFITYLKLLIQIYFYFIINIKLRIRYNIPSRYLIHSNNFNFF